MGLLLLMGGSGFSGALDNLGTGLESAWSVGRRLRAAYTGPIIRVRRSSDNAEQDFSGSGANGAVSASAVAAFCGAGDGFLTTIYDQSGNGRSFTQSSSTVQPLVVSSGVAITENGRLSAEFDGATSSRRMSIGSSTGMFNFLHNGTSSSFYSVQRVDNTAGTQVFLSNSTFTSDPGVTLRISAAENLEIFIRNAVTTLSVSSNKTPALNFNVLTAFFDADNSTDANRESCWLDGVLMGGSNASTNASTTNNAGQNLFLGSSSNLASFFDGRFCEMAIWSQDRTASRTIFEANAKQFWGTP